MIICKNCGGELPDDAKFCTKCGYAIWDVEGVNQEPRAAEPAEAAPAYDDWNAQAQQPAPQYKPYPENNYANNTYQGGTQYPDPQPYGGYQDNYNAYRDTPQADNSQKNAEGRTAMILAIIGAVLSEFGIPGIILCAIAKGKVKAWEKKYGPATGMAKAAKIISTVGMVFSIFMTVFWAIYIIAIFVLIAKGGGRVDVDDIFDVFEDFFYYLR